MNSRYFRWIAGGLFVTALIGFPTQAAVRPANLNQKMIDAADEALKATTAVHDVGRATGEDVYRWSLRVLEANQRTPEAVNAHLARMQTLYERALAKQKLGVEGGDANIMPALRYYVVEAESFVGG